LVSVPVGNGLQYIDKESKNDENTLKLNCLFVILKTEGSTLNLMDSLQSRSFGKN